MSPDFSGLQVLSSFLASINSNELKNDSKNKPIEVPQFTIPTENKLSCKICRIATFSTLEEFKFHRQSEEHLENLTESMSISSEMSGEEDDESVSNSKGSPLFEIVHKSSKLQCYKVLISHRKDELYPKLAVDLDYDVLNRLNRVKDSCIIIALNGGGYFAAAIFDNSKKQMICSKTFRRYTTRRKQGGSQSLKDNQKSGIHSAGSTIRRENEKKLKDEIENLIISWKSHMERCSLIFCNRDPFLTQEVFKDYDCGTNLRTLPFTTYQANFEEICRCYTELISSIKILE